MNALAERYVKLVLALGQHDADYVDAYYGPPEWRKDAEATKRPLGRIDRDAAAVLDRACSGKPAQSAEESTATSARVPDASSWQRCAPVCRCFRGRSSHSTRSRRRSTTLSPRRTQSSEFDAVLQELESRLPGQGSLSERYDTFRVAIHHS